MTAKPNWSELKNEQGEPITEADVNSIGFCTNTHPHPIHLHGDKVACPGISITLQRDV